MEGFKSFLRFVSNILFIVIGGIIIYRFTFNDIQPSNFELFVIIVLLGNITAK